jgi:hypothetical protein
LASVAPSFLPAYAARQKQKISMETVQKTADRLTILTVQMDALAGELWRLGNDPVKREAIVKEIAQLGELYLTIRADTDLSLQDR